VIMTMVSMMTMAMVVVVSSSGMVRSVTSSTARWVLRW
jgi:hypothetical protein